MKGAVVGFLAFREFWLFVAESGIGFGDLQAFAVRAGMRSK